MSASEKLKALDAAATNGPWESLVFDHLRPGSSPLPMRSVYGDKRQNILRDEPSEADSALIATLRSALPQIAAVVEAAEESVEYDPAYADVNDPNPVAAALSALEEALTNGAAPDFWRPTGECPETCG